MVLQLCVYTCKLHIPSHLSPIVQLDMNSAFIARLVSSKASLAQPKHTVRPSSSHSSSSGDGSSSKSSPSTDRCSWMHEKSTQKQDLRNGDASDGGAGHSSGAVAPVSNGATGNGRDAHNGSGGGGVGDTGHVADKSQVYSGFSEAQVQYVCSVLYLKPDMANAS